MFLLISLISIANATNLNKEHSWEMKKPQSVDICQNATFLKEDVVDALEYWSNYVDTSNIIINENVNCSLYEYRSVQIKIDPSIGLDAYGHVDDLDVIDLDDRYYTENELQQQFGGGATTNDRYIYGLSTQPSRNANTSRTIFVRSTEPDSGSFYTGDIWFKT